MHKSLLDYFTDERIIRAVAVARAKVGKRLHDQQFLRNMTSNARSPRPKADDRFVLEAMPPRTLWKRPGRSRRVRGSSIDNVVWAASEAALRLFRSSAHGGTPWATNLRSIVAGIREQASLSSAAEGTFKIAVRPEVKTKGGHIYRPIAEIDITDRIVIGLTNLYLRDVFDQDFSTNSHAFRAKNASNHHLAVEMLRQFRLTHQVTPVFVGECDIQGFYDCVGHREAWRAFESACARARVRGVAIDPAAVMLFEKYLRSYTFEDAKSCSVSWFAKHDTQGCFKWPVEQLKALYGTDCLPRIGVPQGGALSCLIANLVLHDADLAVNEALSHSGRPSFYARYCDDMVVAATNAADCEKLLSAYTTHLAAIRLPVHNPSPPGHSYDRGHWDPTIKSRAPYRWDQTSAAPGAVPWVAFLGYQVRYDGRLRVRPSSIAKELQKQTKVVDLVLNTVGPKRLKASTPIPTLRHNRILFRLRQKLVSMSCGKVDHRDQSRPNTMCWVFGFRGLEGKPVFRLQLRQLDRGRNRQVARAKQRLGKLVQPATQPSDSDPTDKQKPHFLGRPYSYDGGIK
jgi:hypothetical protein